MFARCPSGLHSLHSDLRLWCIHIEPPPQSFKLTYTFCAGRSDSLRSLYISPSPFIVYILNLRYSLCKLTYAIGVYILNLRHNLCTLTSVFGAGKFHFYHSLYTLTSPFGAGTCIFPSTLCKSCLAARFFFVDVKLV